MKAISLFSGGLDSILASILIRALDIEVQGLFFETPFFPAEKAIESAESIDLPIRFVNIAERHIEVVKRPKYGYGENMNPCIDCHALMLRIAGEMMLGEGADFIITGDVLGQRPMSQNRKALSIIDAESGIKGLILRPLSAKHLPPTVPEIAGWISRDKMLDYSGRSRKPQMALAKKMNITKYPPPEGGCLLTDSIFSRRLADLFSSDSSLALREIELLRFGRHFRIGPKTKAIVGRNNDENASIGTLAKDEDLLVYTLSIPGPTVLVIGDITHPCEDMAASLTASYSDACEGGVEICLKGKGQDRKLIVQVRDKKEFRKYMV
jgi:tRNA-specific 2-thiouridylase